MFRFTIRDLLWLMVVVAIVAGWWVDARAKNAKIRRLEVYEYVSKLESSMLDPPSVPGNYMQDNPMPSRPGFHRIRPEDVRSIEVPNTSHPPTAMPPVPK